MGLGEKVGRALDEEAPRMAIPRFCNPFVDIGRFASGFDPQGVIVVVSVAQGWGLPAVPLQLSRWIAAVAFGSSFVVGIVSGVVPARRAALYDPVDALRYE